MNSKASRNFLVCWLLGPALALLAVIQFRPSTAADANTAPQTVPPERLALREQISKSYKDLLAARRSPQSTGERERSIVAETEEAVTAYLLNRLNAVPRPSCADLEYDLNEAGAEAIAGRPWRELMQDNPSGQYDHVLQDDGAPPTLYIAAFISDGSTIQTYNAIRAFAERDGEFKLVASAGDEFKNHALNVIKLRSFAPNELRFLVYGVYIGNTDGLTKLTVYKFDGSKLETLWNEQSVPHADVSISKDQIVVYSYEQFIDGKRSWGPWPSTRTYYAQVPSGLQVVKVERGEVR